MASGTLEKFLFTDESRFSLYRADGRQQYVGVCVSGLVMLALWIEWPMVAVGLWYGQAYVMENEHVHFIDGILNTQRYRNEILRPIVVPFIHDHHLMLQHDNARPHVARICTQFLEAENIPVRGGNFPLTSRLLFN